MGRRRRYFAAMGGLVRGDLRTVVGLLLLGSLAGLAGCGDFFTKDTGGGGGGSGSGAARLFVMAATTQTASGFTLTGGKLAGAAGNPFGLSYTPQAAVTSRNGNYLYVAGPINVNVYPIGSDGTVGTTTAQYLASVGSLAVSPDGQWLFGLDLITQVLDEWQINSDGSLNTVQPVQYGIGKGTWSPKMVTVAPSGGLIFAALGTAGDAIFTLNTTTGLAVQTLTLPPVDAQTSDNAIALDSTSSYLYLARSGNGSGLGVYTVQSSGQLNAVAGSPYPTGQGSVSIALEGTGKYLYVANRSDSTISGFSIATGGVLTAVTGSPFAAGTGVSSLGVDSTGAYLLAAAPGGSPDLAVYSFDTTVPGKLISVATTAVGTAPTGASIVAATP